MDMDMDMDIDIDVCVGLDWIRAHMNPNLQGRVGRARSSRVGQRVGSGLFGSGGVGSGRQVGRWMNKWDHMENNNNNNKNEIFFIAHIHSRHV